jgi:hypothetical protein
MIPLKEKPRGLWSSSSGHTLVGSNTRTSSIWANKKNNRGIPSSKAEKQWLDSPESSLCSIIQRSHSLDFKLNLPPSNQF